MLTITSVPNLLTVANSPNSGCASYYCSVLIDGHSAVAIFAVVDNDNETKSDPVLLSLTKIINKLNYCSSVVHLDVERFNVEFKNAMEKI